MKTSQKIRPIPCSRLKAEATDKLARNRGQQNAHTDHSIKKIGKDIMEEFFSSTVKSRA